MGIAKITIINGRLAADAELKYSQDALAICTFKVAADSIRKKEIKKDGTEGKKTYWIRCTLFGKQAETLVKYLSKGTAVYVDGNFDIDDWKTKEEESRYTIECTVQTIQLLGSKPQVETTNEYENQTPIKSETKDFTEPMPPQQAQPSPLQMTPSSDNPNDDIPF